MSHPSSDAPAPDDGRSEAPSWYGQPVDEQGDELLGTVLCGSYEIVRALGEGAMGRVYEAHHTRIPVKRFAVKILHPEFRRHPEALKRFQREAEAAATVAHPNVVGVYDVDVAADGRPFIVCEYLDGIELGDYLDEVGKLGPAEAVRIVHQICDGLSEAHAHGVVHRDMKPENVFLVGEREEAVAKVLDFGLSRVEGPGDSLTKAGTVMGTPSYMPPEQARGTRVDERADVYGVGAILYRALTGHRPFEKQDVTATLAAVLTEEPRRPRAHEPSIPAGLEAVIQRAMAKSPEDRFASAEDLRIALEPYRAIAGPMVPERRPRLATSESLDEPIASYARPALLALGLLGLLWLVGVLMSGAASAVILVAGDGERALTATELALLGLGIAGAVLTPVIAFCVHVRRTIWDDTNRVVKLRDTVRGVVSASMGAYAIAALAVRLHDGVLGAVVPGAFARGPEGAGWAPWNLVFVALSLLGGGAMALSRRSLGARNPSRLRQILAGPVLAGATIALGAATVYAGLVVRAEAPAAVAKDDVVDEAPKEAATEPSPIPDEPPPEPTAEATAGPDVEVERAPADALTKATNAGAKALEELAARYPGDKAVMRALVTAHSKDEAHWLAALEWSSKLLAASAEEASWQPLRMLALRAAQAEEPVATRAFELMATQMGRHGPDLLFDLMLAGTQAGRDRARRVLGRDEVRAQASPTVRVAFDLKVATTCNEVLALLDLARDEGDARVAAVLSRLAEGSKKGCGPAGRHPCPAKCTDDDAKAIRAVIATIRKPG
jgi:tRNA A-37 threonylcarbamoyl transferase component Bud32